MDFKNKYLVIVLRSLLGLAFVAVGIMGLFIGLPKDGVSQAGLASFQGMDALGITKLIAVVELVAGLLIVTNYRPALGAVLVAPIIVSMLAYHVMHEPATIAPSFILGLLDAYLGYAYWDKYKALFAP